MGNFGAKLESFNNYMFESGGYKRVIEGLQNTVNIAVLGMLIGMVIGILIATVRVIPKYKTMPKILNGICSVYVALFRGTPIVVQLLVFYYVLFSPSLLNITFMKDPVNVSILVFGLNSGAVFLQFEKLFEHTIFPSHRIQPRRADCGKVRHSQGRSL